MTRKRYIKLLMACGHDRNNAEDWARNAREVMNWSYRADAEFWERVFRDMARVAATGWYTQFQARQGQSPPPRPVWRGGP